MARAAEVRRRKAARYYAKLAGETGGRESRAMNDIEIDFTMDKEEDQHEQRSSRPTCPACGGELIEIRAKLQCSRCHTICETCCEGGRG